MCGRVYVWQFYTYGELFFISLVNPQVDPERTDNPPKQFPIIFVGQWLVNLLTVNAVISLFILCTKTT